MDSLRQIPYPSVFDRLERDVTVVSDADLAWATETSFDVFPVSLKNENGSQRITFIERVTSEKDAELDVDRDQVEDLRVARAVTYTLQNWQRIREKKALERAVRSFDGVYVTRNGAAHV